MKVFGDTNHIPVIDEDVLAIARTAATKPEEFYLVCNSSTSINSVLAVLDTANKTLRVLEHSPRSRAGFWHPHLRQDLHSCTILRDYTKLGTLSISLPSMCANLFSNETVKFTGNLQVRSLHLREHQSSHWAPETMHALQKLLHQARTLIQRSSRCKVLYKLYVELFFADSIFEPGSRSVHGDLLLAHAGSNGR
jgi:hypothetical protein